MADVTTIKLKQHTKKQLAKLGKKGETYDDILARVIKSYERFVGDKGTRENERWSE